MSKLHINKFSNNYKKFTLKTTAISALMFKGTIPRTIKSTKSDKWIRKRIIGNGPL